MTTIFMLLTLLIWSITIYFEIKEREKGEKIFYTFYIVVIWIILIALLSIINSLVVYIIFLAIYIILLYWIYTNFQWFIYIAENFFVKNKKVDKKQLVKLDFELFNMIEDYYKQIINVYKNIYKKESILIDSLLIVTWIVIAILLIYSYFNLIKI
jgi:hypothetical protein